MCCPPRPAACRVSSHMQPPSPLCTTHALFEACVAEPAFVPFVYITAASRSTALCAATRAGAPAVRPPIPTPTVPWLMRYGRKTHTWSAGAVHALGLSHKAQASRSSRHCRCERGARAPQRPKLHTVRTVPLPERSGCVVWFASQWCKCTVKSPVLACFSQRRSLYSPRASAAPTRARAPAQAPGNCSQFTMSYAHDDAEKAQQRGLLYDMDRSRHMC